MKEIAYFHQDYLRMRKKAHKDLNMCQLLDLPTENGPQDNLIGMMNQKEFIIP